MLCQMLQVAVKWKTKLMKRDNFFCFCPPYPDPSALTPSKISCNAAAFFKGKVGQGKANRYDVFTVQVHTEYVQLQNKYQKFSMKKCIIKKKRKVPLQSFFHADCFILIRYLAKHLLQWKPFQVSFGFRYSFAVSLWQTEAFAVNLILPSKS